MKGLYNTQIAHNFKHILKLALGFTGMPILYRWMRQHAFVPHWLMSISPRPIISYWFTLVLTGFVLLSTGVLNHFFPFLQYTLLSIYLVAFVSIGMELGAGPVLLATLIGGLGLFSVSFLSVLTPFYSPPGRGFALSVFLGGLLINGLLLRIGQPLLQLQKREINSEQALQALSGMIGLLAAKRTPECIESDAVSCFSLSSSIEVTSPAAMHLVEQACQFLKCQQASVVALEAGSPGLQSVVLIGSSLAQEKDIKTDLLKRHFQTVLQDQALSAQLSQGNVILLDLKQEQYVEVSTQLHLQSMLISPILFSNELWGLLAFHYDITPEETHSEIKALVDAVVRLVTFAFVHARLTRECEEIRERDMILQASLHHMEEFLSITSHELRTPLTMIKLNLQMLQREFKQPVHCDTLSPAYKLLIDGRFNETCHQLQVSQRMIDDLLDISRIQSGKMYLNIKEHDMVLILMHLVEMQRYAVFPREIKLELPDQCQELLVPLDGTRIEQVVSNYLTNALKYAPGVSPVKVILRVEESEQNLQVLVQDDGPGLSLEEQNHIWGSFQQLDSRRVNSGKNEGLGLGLYISRTIIEQHHGQVGVESYPAKGSTFWFTLPLNREELPA